MANTCWKLFCTVLGILEAALYTVTVFGWPALVFLFVEEGFYGDRCYFDSITNGSDCLATINCTNEAAEDARVQKCIEQEELLNLVYTVAIIGLVSFPMLGYIYDHCGTVCVRIVCICLCAGGFFLMALAERGTEWLLFPGALFHLLGGLQLAITDVQVSTLFPKAQATLTCLVSGATGVSAFAPSLLKLTYQAGVSYKVCMFTFTGIMLLMSSVNTITLPPRQDDDGNNIDKACCLKIRKIYNSSKELSTSCKESSTNVDCKITRADVDKFVSKDEVKEVQINGQHFVNVAYTPEDENTRPQTESYLDVDNKTCSQNEDEVNPKEPCVDRSAHMVREVEKSKSEEEEKDTNTCLQGSLLILKSPTFLMLMLWILCQHTLIVTYRGSFYSLINYYGNNVKSTVSTYTDVYSWFQVGSLFWALLTGLMLDKLVAKATNDDKEQCFVVPFSLTVLAGIVVSVACIIPIMEMQFVAILFHSLLKTGSYAVHLAFITTTFSKEHIGKAYGIQVSVANILTFVQLPIFSWYKYSLESDPLWLGVLFLGICLTASCLPFYLLWRRCRSTRKNSYNL
ncbi:solute carrier family 43 member 3 [Lingula anatina]|uniref:Solute carrier family 43 member 3 n=1 Tax=Lingula anatina TaxID=7574 RepID=A0A1S3INM8_LINAN|nr:solute carrier family 43 member 3 [Lingula anatina]XP_013399807.1 solute carrier family 43 member 3 [Lingula anatina]|eukprot:XP_013399798.1 solute carrier family 43 member 3 [Lingula anatina]